MQRGGVGCLGRGGRSRPGPVTGGPESRQGGRGEEKVGDAATVHGGASPAERLGQTHGTGGVGRRDRQGSVGWAFPQAYPSCHPPPSPPTSSRPFLPASPPAAASSLYASITTHGAPSLPPHCSRSLALTHTRWLTTRPPTPALPPPPLWPLSHLTSHPSLHLWVSVPLSGHPRFVSL